MKLKPSSEYHAPEKKVQTDLFFIVPTDLTLAPAPRDPLTGEITESARPKPLQEPSKKAHSILH